MEKGKSNPKSGTGTVAINSAAPMINPLMGFRLAHLRIIAKAWVDEAFRDKFTKPDAEGNGPDLLDVNNYTDYPDLYSMIANLHMGNVEVQMVDYEKEPTEWNTQSSTGWVGSNDTFIINLPNNPKKDQVEALTAYYQIFPTLFGVTVDSGTVVRGPLPQDLGVDSNPFLEFGGVTLRALALAWENKEFLKELSDETLEDATPVLSRWLGYNNPWNFKLKFQFGTGFKWDAKNKMWTNPPKNVVKLHYPRKPKDSGSQPIALATYNESGPQYPFSCI